MNQPSGPASTDPVLAGLLAHITSHRPGADAQLITRAYQAAAGTGSAEAAIRTSPIRWRNTQAPVAVAHGVMRAVRSKLTGPLLAAQQAAKRITGTGSITFTSGVAAHRPASGGLLAATVNGALEAMVRALALELAPIRVNAISPGWVDTPVWDQLATPEAKQARLADMAARLPGKRIGRPSDIGNAVAFLISDEFITGTVLHDEGAQLLV